MKNRALQEQWPSIGSDMDFSKHYALPSPLGSPPPPPVLFSVCRRMGKEKRQWVTDRNTSFLLVGVHIPTIFFLCIQQGRQTVSYRAFIRNKGKTLPRHRQPIVFTPHYFTISSFFSFLGRLTPAIPKQLFGIQHQTYDSKTVLFIRWDDHRFTIDFEGRVLGQVSLKALKEICKDLTGVPLGGISLMLKETGALLKDDNAPLSCFGVKAGAVIIVKGHKPTVTALFF